ncbi:hypothetical protein CATRI_06425 [Corynebacterium atrinae]|nr:hypothetical protein CATRI_06425 [Corynebacterium atrinae]
MDEIRPLPIRTRLMHGEILDSYAYRHARNNSLRVDLIEIELRKMGLFPRSSAQLHPGRKAAWRALGDLHPRAFSHTDTVAGNHVYARPLCERCCGDIMGTIRPIGLRSDMGWICLTHKRWIGPLAWTGPGSEKQVFLADFEEAIAAERHWRRKLAPRGVTVYSPIALLAEECASISWYHESSDARSEKAPAHAPRIVLYPESVKFTELLTRSSFLNAVVGDASWATKRNIIQREIQRILPDSVDWDCQEAIGPIQGLALNVERVLLSLRNRQKQSQDKWNVLQYWSGTIH